MSATLLLMLGVIFIALIVILVFMYLRSKKSSYIDNLDQEVELGIKRSIKKMDNFLFNDRGFGGGSGFISLDDDD